MINTSIVYYEETGRDPVEQFIVDMFKTGKFAGIFNFLTKDGDDVVQFSIPLSPERMVRYDFNISFMKKFVAFPTPDQYWAYYIQCMVRNEVVNHFQLRMVDYNAKNKSIPTEVRFKNYLNFLRYSFKGKQKQLARAHYLKDLRMLPDSARNMEGGVKTFL